MYEGSLRLAQLAQGSLLGYGVTAPTDEEIKIGNRIVTWDIEDGLIIEVYDGTLLLSMDFDPDDYSNEPRGIIFNTKTGDRIDVDGKNNESMASYMLKLINE